MGVNTLPVAVDDNIIPAEHHNALVEAILLDFVPRNASRVPTIDAGQLGTSLYRWARGFIKEVVIGGTANGLKIYEGTLNELWIEIPNGDSIRLAQSRFSFFRNSVRVFSLTDTGIDWGDIAGATIPLSKVNGFVFNSYTTSTFSSETEGAWSTKYTTTFKAMIFVEVPNTVAYNTTTDPLGLRAVHSNGRFTHLYQFQGDPLAASAKANSQAGGTVIASGVALQWAADNSAGNETITLHIFRL